MNFQIFLALKTDRQFYLIRARACLKIKFCILIDTQQVVKQTAYQKAILDFYTFIGSMFLSSEISKGYSD